MRPVSTGLPCPPSSKFQRGRQADSQREAPWRADAGPFASLAAAQWASYPAAACRRSPCPRAPFWNLFALSSLSPKFQSRREQTFTCWEPGARGPPSATRLLLCGAHHATQQPVAEACALVPLFLWVMLLQRWTIFFAARGRRRLPGRHPWWSDSTLTAPSRSMCHRSLPRARARCLSRSLSSLALSSLDHVPYTHSPARAHSPAGNGWQPALSLQPPPSLHPRDTQTSPSGEVPFSSPYEPNPPTRSDIAL